MIPIILCTSINSITSYLTLRKENVRINVGGIITPPEHLVERLWLVWLVLPRLYLMPMRVGGYDIVKRLICIIPTFVFINEERRVPALLYNDTRVTCVARYFSIVIFIRFFVPSPFVHLFPVFLVSSDVCSFHSLCLLCFYGFPVY